MEHSFTSTILEYDDENVFIPFDEDVLASMGLSVGDSIEVTLVPTVPSSDQNAPVVLMTT